MCEYIGTFQDVSNEDEGDWIRTDNDRIFYRSDGDRWNRGEYRMAEYLVNHIPGWTVLITMGPYRSYDFHYEIYPDQRLIHLDCYSSAMEISGLDIPHRQKNPNVEHHSEILKDLRRMISDLDEEGNDE